MKKAFTLILSLSLFLIIVFFLFEKGYVRLNYPSSKDFPVLGVDVSHHQNEIDWSKLKKRGVRFAFIKATEGGTFKDENFLINVNNAKKENIDIGAYHFFTFCKSAEEQFLNFNESINSIVLDLPPVIDLEFGGNCNLKISKDEVRAKIDSLSRMLEQKHSCKPVYYFTYEFLDHFYKNEKIENPIWIRDIYKKPKQIRGNTFVLWQFANRGRMSGVTTPVDLNVFWGGEDEYREFIDIAKRNRAQF